MDEALDQYAHLECKGNDDYNAYMRLFVKGLTLSQPITPVQALALQDRVKEELTRTERGFPRLGLKDLAFVSMVIERANGFGGADADMWRETERIASRLCLIHSEVSEALEESRVGNLAGFGEELADVLIRLLVLAYGLGNDVAAAAWSKAVKNAGRGHKHGGKAI